MAFTINSFRTAMQKVGGGARPNLFEVRMTPPGNTVNAQQWTFQCKIASIPPMTIGVIEVPYFGRQIKMPGNRTFENLSLTVINDENMEIRSGMEKWHNEFNDHVTNLENSELAVNMADITVVHYGIQGSETGQWKFVDAFPVSLGEIALDWGSNDTIEEFTVEFAYDYWTHSGGAE